MNTGIFALTSMIPALIGPLPAEEKTIETALCGGGVIEIPLPMREEKPDAPCHDQGCHASCNRKRIDPAQ